MNPNRKNTPPFSEGSSVLLGNWVEERSVAHIDNDDSEWLKQGHKCILTTNPADSKRYMTETRQSFIPYCHHEVQKIPIRKDLTERSIREKVVKKYEDSKQEIKHEKIDYQTETKSSYSGFGFVEPDIRNFKIEEPLPPLLASIYTQCQKNFRKNCKFTTPINLRNDNSDL